MAFSGVAVVATPYSLGKLIDWKLNNPSTGLSKLSRYSLTPYSLGKLIDWKPDLEIQGGRARQMTPPYSLGKLIDWKPEDLALLLF